MGAAVFYQEGRGKSAKEAFQAARDDAAWERGHGGYTGSLAEKSEFVMIAVPSGQDPEIFASDLIHDGDGRIVDKWGPAGCIDLGESDPVGLRRYLFFGWASC